MSISEYILFTNDVAGAINQTIIELQPSSVFLLADTNTISLLSEISTNSKYIENAIKIVCNNGDSNKNIDSLTKIWNELVSNKANRNSLLINFGGGMVTDLGGFAAATFKRGIKYINVPTTLLGAVDAAVGGKTAINFAGLKNEIGAFRLPSKVIISSKFFNTLDKSEILSGYAEMIKHSLISNCNSIGKYLNFDLSDKSSTEMLQLVEESVKIKEHIVEQDPTEQGIRKTLNFGHTIGHAFESYAFMTEAPIPHGYAIAHGLVVELILSHLILEFPTTLLRQIAQFVKDYYPGIHFTCNDYPQLLDLMHHDKKNETDKINFTLLKNIGEPKINVNIDDDTIKTAIDIYRDLLGY